MKNLVLWLGAILLVGGGVLIIVSGTMDASGNVKYPTLFNLQSTWNWLAVAGVVLVIAGIVWKIASRKK